MDDEVFPINAQKADTSILELIESLMTIRSKLKKHIELSVSKQQDDDVKTASQQVSEELTLSIEKSAKQFDHLTRVLARAVSEIEDPDNVEIEGFASENGIVLE